VQANREQRVSSNGSQREALRIALHDSGAHPAVTPELLAAIRKICSDAQIHSQGPERSLVEFKLSLTDAANEVELPLGPERSKLLDGLVSTFIEEFYRPAIKANTKLRAFDCGDATRATP
jgi:hypothetical protein